MSDEPLIAQEVARPAGRLLAEVAGVYVPLLALLAAADLSHALDFLDTWPIAAQLAVRIAMPLVVALGGTWLFARRDPNPRAELGLAPMPLPEVVGYGALGFLFAYAGNATMAGLYLAVTRTPPSELLANRGAVLELLGKTPLWMVLPLALVVGFYEELVFRGFVLGRLRKALGPYAPSRLQADVLAVVVTAVLFGALHVYQGWYGICQTFGAGVGLGAIAVWRRSIWPAIAAHAMVDALGLFALHVLGPLLKELVKLPPVH